MKLKHLKAYNTNDVPEHITQEINELSAILVQAIKPHLDGRSPNIVLCAFNFLHAGLLKMYVSDKREEIENAARLAAISIIKNVELLINLKEKGEVP